MFTYNNRRRAGNLPEMLPSSLLGKTTDQNMRADHRAGNGSEMEMAMPFVRFFVSLIIISNAGKEHIVSSSGGDLVLSDFYNETAISRIAFGSCR